MHKPKLAFNNFSILHKIVCKTENCRSGAIAPHTDMSAPVYRSIDISKKNSFSSGLALLKEFDSTAKKHILQRLYRTN